MIQIENYFFEPVEFKKIPKEIGNTRRSFNGKVHTQTSNKYNNFKFRVEGVSPSMLGNLLYLKELNRGDNPQNLTLIDDNNNEYIVTIPSGEFNYDREKGEEETYYWEMTLWEVV